MVYGNALIICSDGRAATIAREIAPNWVVYRYISVGEDSEIKKIVSRWDLNLNDFEDCKDCDVLECQDVIIVHSGNGDYEMVPASFGGLKVVFSNTNWENDSFDNQDKLVRCIDSSFPRGSEVAPFDGEELKQWVDEANGNKRPAVDTTAAAGDDHAARWLKALERRIFDGRIFDGRPVSIGDLKELQLSDKQLSQYVTLQGELWHALKYVMEECEWGHLDDAVATEAIDKMRAFMAVNAPFDVYVLDEIDRLLANGRRAEGRRRVEDHFYSYGQREGSIDGERTDTDGIKVPYSRRVRSFSILIVDDNKEYLEYLAARFNAIAKMEDKFKIHSLKCGPDHAYDSALDRLAQHPDVQGVVIDWDLRDEEGRTGVNLAQHIKEHWPHVFVCMMTGRSVYDLVDETVGLRIAHFKKTDPGSVENAWRRIINDVLNRQETPFFDAVQAYASSSNTVLHALPISGARLVRESGWLSGFGEFYGDNVFHGETSATQAPLDSLLSPQGTLRSAERRAAEVFGASRARFVTNGTSTANKIVHQALLKPGDTVLIDRTCHKSHHYGLALVGAQPVYIQAPPIRIGKTFLGLCGGVDLGRITDAVKAHPTAKMLCLTNCTFDGLVHDSGMIIEAVQETLHELRRQGVEACAPDDFVFFFDEAWFGFATFNSSLRPYTGMVAAQRHASARVYVTQSTHKTLVAFRQGSMVLIRDPKFEDPSADVEQRFEEAVFTHTSTSPSYQIMASLDVGRMWADLDGRRVCDELYRVASNLRQKLNEYPAVKEVFEVVGDDDLTPNQTCNELSVDQTKITLRIKKKGITGRQMNERLFQEYGIQFNKFTNNTFLLILTPGVTDTVAVEVVAALRLLAEEFKDAKAIDDEGPSGDDDLPAGPFENDVKFGDGFTLRDAFFCQPPDRIDPKEPTPITLEALLEMLEDETGDIYVASRFVIPYPPGFPLLVPGQIIRHVDVEYLLKIDNAEVHGLSKNGCIPVWIDRVTNKIQKGT